MSSTPDDYKQDPCASVSPEELANRKAIFRECRIQEVAEKIVTQRSSFTPSEAISRAEQFVDQCDRRMSALRGQP